jgi:alkanesulfonate monooxygenase SsuD/methylene tetrahydromethanopterin reductase-like flavin-dependent oxidoreductase (luciferase family)
VLQRALYAEDLGFRAVWYPEIPAFGHDIWVTLARIADKTKRIKFGIFEGPIFFKLPP